jgi:hypothetical protein
VLDVEGGSDRRGEHHRGDGEQGAAGEQRRTQKQRKRRELEDEDDQDTRAPLARQVGGVEAGLQLRELGRRVCGSP